MPGDHGAETNPDPGPKAFAQETKSLVVALIAEEIVNGRRAVQADLKREPRIENKGIREPGRDDAAGYDLYPAGMVQGRGEDFGQDLPVRTAPRLPG